MTEHGLGKAPARIAGAPEKQEVRVGFMPLTDCAPVVMAAILGFDRKHGIKIVPTREASWASVRDKLTSGDLDAAQALYGLVYGVHMGIGCGRRDMVVLMTLNRNGQAITLANHVAGKGVLGGAGLARLIRQEPRRYGAYTFAHTFPTGTHAMWLYYWLAAHGIHPLRDVRLVTVPPPQMVANMAVGNIDGYCAGEPWNHRAIADNVGITAAASQDIWPGHPEKVLGASADFVRRYPNTARALTAAVLEACRWIDASPANKLRAAETIAAKAYVNTSVNIISPRILGLYSDGAGGSREDPNCMAFHQDGAVNFPYLSDGMWFLTQHKRWGLLKEHPDYLGVARAINCIDLYCEAATMADVAVPVDAMRKSVLIDGITWDGSAPAAYADSFAISFAGLVAAAA
ncbi:CmpA/NrtA family ABC transporter substrate-binding protein [Janthinobacterium sp. 17J80-10]|uniref:CmpA/NrtA family ABC transporter substrate-binding protein n=1 Tax=Janthinobacterium sp. 17J80-10 TaxID=2497863 RepID=UPI001005A5C6|nr:CmpA/NrtA family ABC transporter substrate-binding protein [Janthinobacterium sp. 17J80-10]QAU35591.1 nitrate ABC transporter substrate-binding protein [Janthinobacterium sp. 17J80-10]